MLKTKILNPSTGIDMIFKLLLELSGIKMYTFLVATINHKVVCMNMCSLLELIIISD
jgi:hypothetical protein